MSTTMNIQMIPLDKLVLSKANVRKTGMKIGIAELAESIDASGLIHNLSVKPLDDGRYEVVMGGRRLAALQLLAKQGRREQGSEIGCNVLNGVDLTQASLAENVMRERMHPADEFDAFKKLADSGTPNQDIAARFGTTPKIVSQRLKLARVSPKLTKDFRADLITLSQMMAFTLTDDHARQEQVWNDAPAWEKQRGDGDYIRQALTSENVPVSDKRVKLVGLENYRKAGGAVLDDLFNPETRFVTDPELLTRLVAEKLQKIVKRHAKDGWKWAEAIPDFDHEERQKFGQLRPERLPPTPEQQAEIDGIQAEADAIIEEHGEEPEDEAAYAKLEELSEKLDSLSGGTMHWPLATKANAGVVVTISYSGELELVEGLVRPEDKAAAKKAAKAASSTAPASGAGDGTPKPPGLPAKLTEELTAHKTAALQAMLADNPRVALIAIVHRLAADTFYDPFQGHRVSSPVKISASTPYLAGSVPDIAESRAAKHLDGITAKWRKELPKKPEKLWAYLSEASNDDLLAIMAVCVASSVDVVEKPHSQPADSKPLSKALALDMAEFWTATADGYFSRVSKAKMLEAILQTAGAGEATLVSSQKKDVLAQTAERAVVGKRWLPPILKAG